MLFNCLGGGMDTADPLEEKNRIKIKSCRGRNQDIINNGIKSGKILRPNPLI